MSDSAQKNSGPLQTPSPAKPESQFTADTTGKKEIPIPQSIHAIAICRSFRSALPMPVLLSRSFHKSTYFTEKAHDLSTGNFSKNEGTLLRLLLFSVENFSRLWKILGVRDASSGKRDGPADSQFFDQNPSLPGEGGAAARASSPAQRLGVPAQRLSHWQSPQTCRRRPGAMIRSWTSRVKSEKASTTPS